MLCTLKDSNTTIKAIKSLAATDKNVFIGGARIMSDKNPPAREPAIYLVFLDSIFNKSEVIIIITNVITILRITSKSA